MRLTAALCTLALIAAMGCATAPIVEYRRPPPPVVDLTQNCDPNYPCPTSYYWDEWREVYVYYDGYRYIDCTGLPGGYPLPPVGVVYRAPPRGYVPPTAWVPPHGTYHAPVGFVARGGPAPPLPQPPRDAYGNPNNAGLVGRMPQAWSTLPAPQPPQQQAYPYPYAGQPPAQGYQGQAQPGYVGPQNPNRYGEPNRPYEAVPPPQPSPRGEIVEPPRDGRPSAYGPPPRQEAMEPPRSGYGAPPPPASGARSYEPERRPPAEAERPAMQAPAEQRERMETPAVPEQPQQKKSLPAPPPQHNAANPGPREPAAREPASH